MRSYLTIVIILFAALSYACANPAANKPKATVANAAPESGSAKPANAETLIISPENSKVEFIAAKGAIGLVNNSVADSRVMIDIQMSSVVTDEDDLTKHLQTPDFFDVARYPKATFTSTKIVPILSPGTSGVSYDVSGNFDLHGIKKTITFPATIEVAPDNVSVNAEFAINRKDFGIVFQNKADDLIRDGVVIKLTLKAPRTK
ncbi:MAG: YceI family protein [Acidobacteria bacterium]|nr:MAG: YceI family protein [Acidobacteriota bacterium]